MASKTQNQESVEVVGRYALHAPIAKGGMAVVHLARILGPEGFSRIVAAKRLFPHFVEDADFVSMFLDEARIASKIHHQNVVPAVDIVLTDNDVVLIQEYVHGVPLDKLVKGLWVRKETMPPAIISAVMGGMLAGLHAAHEAKDEYGEPLHVVHRDVSPQNVMVSADGIARVLDFGIAKARSSSHVTREGVFKGKVAYVAPEQLRGLAVTRRADIYGAGVMLWELLAGRKLFSDDAMDAMQIMARVLEGAIPSVRSALANEWSSLLPERKRAIELLEPVIARALAFDPDHRYATADAMHHAISDAIRPASVQDVGGWVREHGREFLEAKQRAIAESEEISRRLRVTHTGGPESATRIVLSDAPNSASSLSSMSVPAVPSSAPSVRVVSSSSPATMSADQISVMASVMAQVPQPAHRRWLPVLVAFAIIASFSLAMVITRGPNPRADEASFAAAAAAAVSAAQSKAAASQPQAVAPIVDHAPPAEDHVDRAPPAEQPEPRAAAPRYYAAPARPRPVAPRPAPRNERPAETATASAAPPPPPPAATPPDCSPPYYMEGTKKVFKPNCL